MSGAWSDVGQDRSYCLGDWHCKEFPGMHHLVRDRCQVFYLKQRLTRPCEG